ncbi:UPF0496 protein At4g34320-like [Eucalyptus grandis]|uniref:UPF0496 protein At4g34320-like n=1 Tax=Eucalyptus grandis TaxID=71139 RepID=UPI00192EB4E7|nr:UPF0496 protein At4g34320-like [Eucalyptus grandis]
MANSNTRRNPPMDGAACESDPDPRTFNANLQARTNQVLSTLASGVDVQTLSLDSLKEISECLLEMNQEVVKVILDSKKDIWRNEELLKLVQDYFNDSLPTLDFCASLENCLKHTIYKLQKFMLKKLWIKKKKIEKKLKSIQMWRKISSMIPVVTFAAILIYSVTTAMVASPPVVVALSAATAMDVIGKWIDSLWKHCEEALKRWEEVITSMQASIFVALKDLDKMRITIDPLEVQMKSLLQKADFPIEAGAEAVKLGIADIKKKLRDFMKDVKGLGKDVDMCSRNLQRSRLVVLQRIIKPPTNCNGAPM